MPVESPIIVDLRAASPYHSVSTTFQVSNNAFIDHAGRHRAVRSPPAASRRRAPAEAAISAATGQQGLSVDKNGDKVTMTTDKGETEDQRRRRRDAAGGFPGRRLPAGRLQGRQRDGNAGRADRRARRRRAQVAALYGEATQADAGAGLEAGDGDAARWRNRMLASRRTSATRSLSSSTT